MSKRGNSTLRPRFSLGTLLALVGLGAVFLALVVALGQELVLGFAGFLFSCGFVLFMVFLFTLFARASTGVPYQFAFVLVPASYCFLELAFFLFGEAIDQPHPTYEHGNWVTVALSGYLPGLPIMAIAILVLMAIDRVIQTSRPRDPAYYPLASNLRAVFSVFETRLVLVVGVMLVLGYYAGTVVDAWHHEQFPGMYWPPKRVFVACNLLWGVLWLSDCLARPNKGTLAAAIGFLVFAFFFLLPTGFGGIRE